MTSNSTETSTLLQQSSKSPEMSPIFPSNSISYHLPTGTSPLENQVAGHTFQEGTNSIGLLKDQCSRTVLKPVTKPICGAREINFYESLQFETNPDLVTLKRLVPEYKGTVKIEINNKEIDFIRLEDLTYDMIKPCIIDIKIGKRTWDPEATLEKIQAEEEKYSACKKTLGLCIPGFQVHILNHNDNNEILKRYSKDYGKQLNENTFIDTIKLFLNFDYGYCRELIIQILNKLLDIRKWSRTQKSLQIYSSSILIVYDAKRLKYCINNSKKYYCNCCNKQNILNSSVNYSGSLFATSINNLPSDVNSYSSQNNIITTNITNINTKSQKHNSTNMNHICEENSEKLNGINHHHYSQLCNHQQLTKMTSTTNPICPISSKYTTSLMNSFVRVKMIDFAHVFPVTNNTIDENYLFGIENLVKIFESFLNEYPPFCDQEKSC